MMSIEAKKRYINLVNKYIRTINVLTEDNYTLTTNKDMLLREAIT